MYIYITLRKRKYVCSCFYKLPLCNISSVKEIPGERSILWEVIISAIVRKFL